MTQLWQRIIMRARRYGWRHTLHVLALRTVNLGVPLQIFRGVAIGRVNPAFVNYPDGYTGLFLNERMLRTLAADPGSQMSRDFVDEALSKGDQCYGLMHGTALAAYGWYSKRPTTTGPDMRVHFSDDYVYMFKGFTHPEHRGKRLHAIGMTLALQFYLSRGYNGLVSTIESENAESLKSSFRMGYVQFGSIYVLRLFARAIAIPTRGCAAYRFSLRPNGALGGRALTDVTDRFGKRSEEHV